MGWSFQLTDVPMISHPKLISTPEGIQSLAESLTGSWREPDPGG